jgi:AcrR family transcriptional regulator
VSPALSESPGAGAPRRSDALRNRERILSVAYAAFSDDPDVSLNTIAKLAGVGPGTLYRHFPSREDLILALYQHEVQAVVDSVAQNVINDTYAPVTAAVGELLTAAEQAGQVRSGLDPADILLLMGFLWRVGPGDPGAHQAERILDIVIDGLRPGS